MRKIESLGFGIYKIDNFISKDSCEFLTNILNTKIEKTPMDNIYGSLGSKNPEYLSLVGKYGLNKEYNIALDFFNSIVFSLVDIVSVTFKESHILKQTFYSVMKTGGENEIHVDNVAKENAKDKSALLYLNDNFEGGELVFPEQNLTISPKPGTVIFFEGNRIKPHGVNKVLSGERYNVITFFEPRSING